MKDPLLTEIDKMIEDESEITPCSYEISFRLREIRKLIIADRERIIESLRRNADWGEVELKDAIAIVKGEKEE